MSRTEPIREKEELKNFVNYYKVTKKNYRNYCLIQVGLNTALRISDVLSLTWDDVFDFKRGKIRNHLCIKEAKTGKSQNIFINDNLANSLLLYKNSIEFCPQSTQYLFPSMKKPLCAISRIQAYRIIKAAAISTLTNSEHISCHSLRKTFGYYAWRQGAQPALLMDIYNHSSYEITKRYLGINQDEKDKLYQQISF